MVVTGILDISHPNLLRFRFRYPEIQHWWLNGVANLVDEAAIFASQPMLDLKKLQKHPSKTLLNLPSIKLKKKKPLKFIKIPVSSTK